MKQEVLTIYVDITDVFEVKGISGEAVLLSFTGTADSEYFKGKILPGGVDTQKKPTGVERTLSARYMLEGIDHEGNACRIFIENNGVEENGLITKTIPKIYTDSKALAFLETADLFGTISPKENGVIIHIFYCKEEL